MIGNPENKSDYRKQLYLYLSIAAMSVFILITCVCYVGEFTHCHDG